ncbi:TPA: staphylocoagulase, partial [Staphylococcus aureus]|nr:staphylocoagulase [Staphylococcus aureus]HCY5004141.1 staphylocoagulase [Staphylococcus aureus]
MKKQIISLGALAVASSLFTWDNKADAIVTKDYSKESRVNEKSKKGATVSDYYYWKIIDSLEAQFTGAIDLLEDYKYGDPIYKEAKDRLMTRVLGEDQYLLKKKIDEYELYKKWYKSSNKNTNMLTFHKYNLYNLTMNEYNDIFNSLKDAVYQFNKEVKEIEHKNVDLKQFDKDGEDKATKEVYDLVSEIDTLVVTYYADKDYGEHAKELRAKLDLILGDTDNPHKITNERIKKEMIDDLNSIIDDFFMETKQNRP